MIVVGSWLLFKGPVDVSARQTQNEYYKFLATKLIDIDLSDETGRTTQNGSNSFSLYSKTDIALLLLRKRAKVRWNNYESLITKNYTNVANQERHVCV